MSAIAPLLGRVRQLDRRAEPDEQVTPEQVQDPERLARLLMGILRDVATLRRRFWPRRVDFEDRSFDATGTTLYRFTHGFGGRVRWWPVDVTSGTASLTQHADTDDSTLVLVSSVACTATIRVEAAG